MKSWLKHQLYKEYGIMAEEIQMMNRLWSIRSPQGKWVIKPYKNSRPLIQWLSFLTSEIRGNGFKQIPNILINQHGLPWFGTDQSAYIVMPHIDGKKANYAVKTDVEKAVKSLAVFHHHAGWIDDKQIPPFYPSLKKKLLYRMEQFERVYQAIIMKEKKTDLEKMIGSLGKDMIKFAKEALELISFSMLDQMQQEALENRLVAHRDLASHNFLINNQTWIIDLDLAAYEAQFLDLWQLLNRVMLEWEWDLASFIRIEDVYHGIRKLQGREKKIIRQLSLFPNDFFRESIGPFKFPGKYQRENTEKIIKRFIDHFEKYDTFRKRMLTL